uniref:COMM domain containing 8 n=1 Tax=Jaculus jaculus TaxID=51337 RepID=A0A8C5KBM6_JACJA
MEPEEGSALWRLHKLPPERGAPLLHKIIDGLCGRAYPRHQDYLNVWNSAEWRNVIEDVTKFFKAVVGKNFSDEEALEQLSQLNSCHQETILKCLKLALSSDKIATLQMPLLNLHLDVKENGDVKPYSVEMSKEELHMLITSLEAANKVVLQLK